MTKKRRAARDEQHTTECMSFFKIMLGKGYPEAMNLPPLFAKKLMHLNGQDFSLEDSSGHQWVVTLTSLNGSLAFENGWNQFILDHDVKEGEFLVFNYIFKFHFVVHIFGTTACERNDFRSQHNKIWIKELDTFSENGEKDACKVKKGTSVKLSKMQFEDPVCVIERNMPIERENRRRILLDLSSFEMPKGAKSKALIDFEKTNNDVPEVFACPNELITPATIHCFSSDTSMGRTMKVEDAENLEKTVKKAHSNISMDQCENRDKDSRLFKMKQNHRNSSNKIGVDFDKNDDCASVILKPRAKDSVQDSVNNMSKVYADNSVKSFQTVKKEMHNEATELNRTNLNRSQMALKLAEGPFSSLMANKKFLLSSCNGKHNIKKEFSEQAFGFTKFASGKRPTAEANHSQMLLSSVKTEPILPHPEAFEGFTSFSAQVKSLIFLEFRMNAGIEKRRDRECLGRLIYLEDSKERLWPCLMVCHLTAKAIICNWDNFCRLNLIRPGDFCHFRPVDDCVYVVEITHS